MINQGEAPQSVAGILRVSRATPYRALPSHPSNEAKQIVDRLYG